MQFLESPYNIYFMKRHGIALPPWYNFDDLIRVNVRRLTRKLQGQNVSHPTNCSEQTIPCNYFM